MKITVYAKKRTTEEGKTFYSYLSTLTRKDGTPQVVTVKFRDECGSPRADKCPMNIDVPKSCANLSQKRYERKDGTVGTSYTLWVSAWDEGEAYVDHSLDEFD